MVRNYRTAGKRGFMVILTILFLFIGTVGYCFAEGVDAVANVGTGRGEINSICARANNVVGVNILSYDSKEGLLSFSNSKYAELNRIEKQEFMQAALDATNGSSLGVQGRNKVYNFISEQDNATAKAVGYLKSNAGTDLAEAGAWFRPFASWFGIAFGVFSVFIVALFGISIMLDICYFGIPAFEAVVSKGNGKPILVSKDAWSVRKDIDSSGVYQNEILAYMKRRIVTIIAVGVCLAYLISGKVYDIILFFVDAFSNF